MMDRTRFEYLLAAYGADFSRWPAGERGAAALYAKQNAGEAEPLLSEARALDEELAQAHEADPDVRLLAARVLAAAPKPAGGLDAGALVALAACAAFGVVLGYGGGLFAPLPAEDGAFFAMAFEAPVTFEDEG